MTARTDSQPLVSVVMSTYREISECSGNDSLLSRAIDSVLAQTHHRWELWIVADCPPARDRERIAALVASRDDDRVHLHNLQRRAGIGGVGAVPKQEGVVRSSGEYLAFLDADNEWTPGHLGTALKAFRTDDELDLVYCDSIVRLHGHQPNSVFQLLGAGRTGLRAFWGDEFLWQKPDWCLDSRRKLRHFNFIDISEAVMKRAAYEDAGGVEAKPYYDWRLWNKMLAAGRGSFRHSHHVGLYYSTSTLAQHHGYYSLSRFATMPYDVATFPVKLDQLANPDRRRLDEYRQRNLQKHS